MQRRYTMQTKGVQETGQKLNDYKCRNHGPLYVLWKAKGHAARKMHSVWVMIQSEWETEFPAHPNTSAILGGKKQLYM